MVNECVADRIHGPQDQDGSAAGENAKQIVGRSGEASISIITGVTLGRLMFAWFKSGDFGEAYCR